MRFLLQLALLTLLLSGCAKRESPVNAALRTRTLIVGNLAEPRDLDPQVLALATDFNLAVALFEGLLVFDEASARPIPAVATHWEISDDLLTYTFHLRPDAKWSNGDQVTARDFAYSFQRMLSPGLAAEYAYLLWPIKNAEAFTSGKRKDFRDVGVAALDDVTLRLTLERPTPYLLSLAAHVSWMPVHRPTIEKFGRIDERNSAWTRPGNLVSNGAFKLTEWKPNSRIVMAKNPHYWNAAQTALQQLVFVPIENAEAEERDFRAGQLHVTHTVPLQKVTGYRSQAASPLRIEEGLRNSTLYFNVAKAPVDQLKVRQALSLALNREAIARSVTYDTWKPALSFTPPGCGDYAPPAGRKADAEEARRLLAAAGFPGGKGLPSLPLTIVNESVSAKMAEAIQAMWQKELGVQSTVEMVEQKIWIQNLASRNYVMTLYGWIADYPDATTFLDLCRTGNGNNYTGWSNRDYDTLLDRANLQQGAARNDLLRQAEALMLGECPAAPLFFNAKIRLVHPHVRNWTASPLDIHRYQLIDLKN